MNDSRKSNIRKTMKTSLEKQSSGSLIKISEDTLEDRRLVILSGLAGSGKSIVPVLR